MCHGISRFLINMAPDFQFLRTSYSNLIFLLLLLCSLTAALVSGVSSHEVHVGTNSLTLSESVNEENLPEIYSRFRRDAESTSHPEASVVCY